MIQVGEPSLYISLTGEKDMLTRFTFLTLYGLGGVVSIASILSIIRETR